MGQVIIQSETTKNPITLIGQQAGICYGANTEDKERNYKRGLDCLSSNHGRTFEFPDVYMIIDGYSARVIREWYTHIGGAPTRLQASTRYINYQKGFDYITPPKVEKNAEALKIYGYYTVFWKYVANMFCSIFQKTLEFAGITFPTAAFFRRR